MASKTSRPPMIIAPTATHTATVIFLHGLGGCAEDIFYREPMKWLIKLPENSHIKWIFPNAPLRSITINFRAVMPAWFDVLNLDFGSPPQDEAGMLESAEILKDIIQTEIDNGLAPGRIMLGGFSQGAAMTLLTGLTKEIPLAGLIVLSGRIPMFYKFKEIASSKAPMIPIFQAHGTNDPLVPLDFGIKSNDLLKELGYSSDTLILKVYQGMDHNIEQQEVRDLQLWLQGFIGNH